MHLITRLLLGTAVLTAGAIMPSLPASASVTCDDPGSLLLTDQNSATANLNCPGSPSENNQGQDGKNNKSTSHGKPACVWVPKPDYQGSPSDPVEGQGGHWY